MNLVTFILLVLTFPYWFPPVAFFFIGLGAIWMVCYPTACTVHMLYYRLRYKKWCKWQLIPYEFAPHV